MAKTARSREAKKSLRADFLSSIHQHSILYATLLALPTDNDAAALLNRTILRFFETTGAPYPSQNPEPIQWACSILSTSKSALPTNILNALSVRRRASSIYRCDGRHLVDVLFKEPSKCIQAPAIFNIWLPRLPSGEEYPPRNHWVANSAAMHASWSQYLANLDQPDHRIKRKPVHLLNPTSIRLSIPPGLTCHVFDSDSKELVFVCNRRLIRHSGIMNWASGIIHEATITRKSVRLEDPGYIIQAGFSAGARRLPVFGMVRNFLSPKKAASREASANQDLAALFAAIWLAAKARFPQEIIADFEEFYDKYNIPRFDPAWPSSSTKSATLKIPLQSGTYQFTDVERGPGCGVVTQRYARAVHRENQPHKWALAWTNQREGANVGGGHFYYSEYAIELEMVPDTAFAWAPALFHTSGLSNVEPTFDIPELPDSNHNQQGLAFVTSNRIVQAYTTYANTNLSPEEKVREAFAAVDRGPAEEENIYE